MHWFFPDNYMWDLGAAIAINSGGTVGEVATVAARLADAAPRNSLPDWVEAFSDLSVDTEAIGRAQLEDEHWVGAGESLTRASVYAQVALRFEPPGTSRRDQLLERSLSLFEEGLRYRSERIELISLPYEGHRLRGYVALPPQSPGPCPVVAFVGGLDATTETMVQRALPLTSRGLAVLVVDGPGYGEALQRQGLTTRHDYEAVGRAVADYVEGAESLDASRLGLMGISLGGYYAMRVAAFEPRFRAVAAWGAIWDAGSGFRSRLDHYTSTAAANPVSAPSFQLQYVSGTDSTQAALDFWDDFHLRDVAQNVEAPALVLHGENDRQVSVVDAYRVYTSLGSQKKQLHIVPRGMPGAEHCQWDGIRAAQQPLSDFFQQELASR